MLLTFQTTTDYKINVDIETYELEIKYKDITIIHNI
jgi:hypothetical protein